MSYADTAEGPEATRGKHVGDMGFSGGTVARSYPRGHVCIKDAEMGVCGAGFEGRLSEAGMGRGVSKRHEWFLGMGGRHRELWSANTPSTKETGMRLAYWSQ